MNENQTTNTTEPTAKELAELKALTSQDVVKIKESYFPGEDDYSFWTLCKQLRGQRTLKLPVLLAGRKYLAIQSQKKELEKQLLAQ